MKEVMLRVLLVLILAIFGWGGDIYASWFSSEVYNNLHIIDESANGFVLYRSGRPELDDVKHWCEIGISEIMVLSGDAEEFDKKYVKQTQNCNIKIVYNKTQVETEAVTKQFLDSFSDWVENARKSGKKILFRCKRGAHRTGRLAAYYEMKYMSLPLDYVLEIMQTYGVKMWWYNQFLKPQLIAYYELLNNLPCTQNKVWTIKGIKDFCVQ